MLILALESSAKPASAAVVSDGELLGYYFQNSGLTHSKTLLSMAEKLLRGLDLTTNDIDLFAVSSGPGSFTGVRIGVSAVKGLAWGADKPVCGVSTLEAMAYLLPQPGTIICPVMDARRGQVYNALFDWSNGGLHRLCPDRAIALEELSESLERAGKSAALIGDGAELAYEFLTAQNIPCTIAPGLNGKQSAYGVALAAVHNPQTAAVRLEPSYLRPSQAERERSERRIIAADSPIS